MRIVGGEYKGRIFNPGKKFKARPTTDQAKEGLFNILQNRYNFDELKVLDLFGGTGSISYEFASRGSLDITLIEQNHDYFKFIHTVINELNITCIKALKRNALSYIEKCNDTFDLIFADPPFDLQNLETIPDLLFSTNILDQKGVFILEHPKRINFSQHKHFQELRKYGNVNFSFFSFQ